MSINKKGFTLVELLSATVIALLFIAALLAIYINMQKHAVAAFRESLIKSADLLTMEHFRNTISKASMIEYTPGFSSCVFSSATPSYQNVYYIGGATNTDALTGCRPLSASAGTPKWFFYCIGDSATSGYYNLHYFEGTLAADSSGCSVVPLTTFSVSSNFPTGVTNRATCKTAYDSSANPNKKTIAVNFNSGYFTIYPCQRNIVGLYFKNEYPARLNARAVNVEHNVKVLAETYPRW